LANRSGFERGEVGLPLFSLPDDPIVVAVNPPLQDDIGHDRMPQAGINGGEHPGHELMVWACSEAASVINRISSKETRATDDRGHGVEYPRIRCRVEKPLGMAQDDIQARISLQGDQLDCCLVWHPAVVGIQKGDQIPMGDRNAGVHSFADARVSLSVVTASASAGSTAAAASFPASSSRTERPARLSAATERPGSVGPAHLHIHFVNRIDVVTTAGEIDHDDLLLKGFGCDVRLADSLAEVSRGHWTAALQGERKRDDCPRHGDTAAGH
jgi:hypothetical protein